MATTEPDGPAANRLREHRLRRGLEQRDVAEALGGLAVAHGLGEIAIDAHAVSRHERGRHRPRRHHRRLYCLLFHTDEATLWPPDRGTGMDPVLSAGWSHAGTVASSVSLTGSSGLVDRRAFLVLAGGALTAPAHEWLVREPGPLLAAIAGDRVTPDLADRLPPMIAELRGMDDAQGGGLVLSLAGREFDWVAELLDNASYDEQTGRRLHSALAELGQLAGWVAYDAGRHGLAQRYYLAALHAAHTAGDRSLGAHVLGSMAYQAARQGRPGEAVNLVDTALAGSRTTGPAALLCELYSRQAYALSILRDAPACEAAVTNARAYVERIDPRRTPPWLYWVSQAEILAGAGDCMLQLERAGRAIPALREGIGLFAPALARDRHLYLTHLAEALARPGPQRDLEAAAEAGEDALDLADGLNSSRSLSRIRDLHRQLAPYDDMPAVRSFVERAGMFLVA